MDEEAETRRKLGAEISSRLSIKELYRLLNAIERGGTLDYSPNDVSMFGDMGKNTVRKGGVGFDKCFYCVSASDDPNTIDGALERYFVSDKDAFAFAAALDRHDTSSADRNISRRYNCVWVGGWGIFRKGSKYSKPDWIWIWWSRGVDWGDLPEEGYGRPTSRASNVEYDFSR